MDAIRDAATMKRMHEKAEDMEREALAPSSVFLMSSTTMKPSELAEFLKVSKTTLASWRRKERGPRWVGVGRGIRYRRSDVDAWLEQREGRHLK